MFRGRRRLLGGVLLLALALSAVFLALPLMGTDLSAAEAHRDFARAHPLTPIDFRWYGGINQFGYSLLSQHLTGLLGTRVAGALAATSASVLVADLMQRTRVRRPLLAAVAATICIFGNLVSGRIAWALGVAVGAASLDLLAARRPRWARVFAVLTTLVSPVAGLFLALIAGGLLPFARWRREGLLLGLSAGVPLVVLGLAFGDGGTNTFSGKDFRHAAALLLAVAACAAVREVRAAALVVLASAVVFLLVANPVGLAVMRLPVMFAIPVVLALTSRTVVAVVVVAAIWWYQPPVSSVDWRHRGDAASTTAYVAGLKAELALLGVAGRVEVVPTREYWEAARVASEDMWLARGWLRQADTRWNGLFFKGDLTDSAYRAWLLDNGVEYVALPTHDVSWVGRREAHLLEHPGAELTQIWQDRHWRLFRVEDATAIVAAPARVLSRTADSLVVEAPAAGDYAVKIRWSRWLHASSGSCLRRDGAWSLLKVKQPGSVRIASSLVPQLGGCK